MIYALLNILKGVMQFLVSLIMIVGFAQIVLSETVLSTKQEALVMVLFFAVLIACIGICYLIHKVFIVATKKYRL